ncbi:hypothetical protein, partial [Teichococcus wenyumeiae]
MRRRVCRPPRLTAPAPEALPPPTLPPSGDTVGRRFLALHLPLLPVEATGRAEAPTLVWRAEG